MRWLDRAFAVHSKMKPAALRIVANRVARIKFARREQFARAGEPASLKDDAGCAQNKQGRAPSRLGFSTG